MGNTSNLQHRKAQSVLHVTDVSGNPVANTELQLKMKRHEFLFGCGLL